MDLRQLEYFRAACRAGNITRASEELNVSQPSVTNGIRRLEEELGVKLLDRSRKRISITVEGRIFLNRTEEILALVHDSAAEMRDHDSLKKGRIRLGITPMMGSVLFPSTFARFRKTHPNVEMTVAEEGSLSIGKRLARGELDVGILITSDLPAGLSSIPVRRDRIVSCLPPAHRLAEHGSISFGMLRNEPLILFREDTYSRQAVTKECARYGFEPKVVFTSSQIGTVLNLVRQGVGIAFFIEEIVRNQRSIAIRPLTEPLVLPTGLAWNGGRYVSKAVRAFIESFGVIGDGRIAERFP